MCVRTPALVCISVLFVAIARSASASASWRWAQTLKKTRTQLVVSHTHRYIGQLHQFSLLSPFALLFIVAAVVVALSFYVWAFASPWAPLRCIKLQLQLVPAAAAGSIAASAVAAALHDGTETGTVPLECTTVAIVIVITIAFAIVRVVKPRRVRPCRWQLCACFAALSDPVGEYHRKETST